MADPATTEAWDAEVRADGPADGKSAGTLMKEVTEGLSTLVRKEIELAKQEIGDAVASKAKGAAIVAVAGVFAFFALIFLLLALRDGLNEFFWAWVADLLTAGILLALGAVAILVARKMLSVPISAERTKQTIKEDVEWAKTLGRG
ncbi:MAG: phage holin family protein [Actinomycetota bacterium]